MFAVIPLSERVDDFIANNFRGKKLNLTSRQRLWID